MARVAPSTITRLERGNALHARTVAAILRALEDAGAEFIPAVGASISGGAGVRLKIALDG